MLKSMLHERLLCHIEPTTMAILGAGALSAGGAIGGGILSSKKNYKLAKKQLKFQKDLSKNQILYRTQDAKRAGIHPLFALGASPQPTSPVTAGDQSYGLSDAGQKLGNAIRSGVGAQQQKDQDAKELAALKSGLANDDMRRQLIQSEIRLNNQKYLSNLAGPEPQNAVMDPNHLLYKFGTPWEPGYEKTYNSLSGTMPSGNDIREIPLDGTEDVYQRVPSKIPTRSSKDPATTAGPHAPMWKPFKFTKDMPIDLPESDTAGEAFEQVPTIMYWRVYDHNVEKYGKAWGDKFRDKMTPALFKEWYQSAVREKNRTKNLFKKGGKWINERFYQQAPWYKK